MILLMWYPSEWSQFKVDPWIQSFYILVHDDEHMQKDPSQDFIIQTEILSYHFTEQLLKLSPLLINLNSSIFILLAFAGVFILQ